MKRIVIEDEKFVSAENTNADKGIVAFDIHSDVFAGLVFKNAAANNHNLINTRGYTIGTSRTTLKEFIQENSNKFKFYQL
jgi:hypothetical protein